MIPSFPARPTNGGALESALPKVGAWAYEPKVGDWRGLVHGETGQVWNRYGRRMPFIERIEPALHELRSRLSGWIDVGIMDRQPLMRGCIIVFDYLPIGEEHLTYDQRRFSLETWGQFEVMPLNRFPHSNSVFLVPQLLVEFTSNVLTLYRTLDEINVQIGAVGTPMHPLLYEGLVAKRRDKPYPMQLRSPDIRTPWWIKHRFDQQ